MLGMGFGVFSAGIFLGIAHWKAGNVRSDWLLPLIIPGVVGGMLGAYLLGSLPREKYRFWNLRRLLSTLPGKIANV